MGRVRGAAGTKAHKQRENEPVGAPASYVETIKHLRTELWGSLACICGLQCDSGNGRSFPDVQFPSRPHEHGVTG
jgi:hypothetical protein